MLGLIKVHNPLRYAIGLIKVHNPLRYAIGLIKVQNPLRYAIGLIKVQTPLRYARTNLVLTYLKEFYTFIGPSISQGVMYFY
jgi:hypothetical protein